MGKQIYICKSCNHAFYYSKAEAAGKLCRYCLQEGLESTDRLVVVCPTCLRHYDSHLIENRNEKPLDNAPDLQLGMLICSRDQSPLETHGIKEDIGRITEEILQKFSERKLHQQQEEAEFIQKLTDLREEINIDAEVSSVPEPHEDAASLDAISAPLLPVEKRFKELIIPTAKITNAIEFWDYYQNPELRLNSKYYFGGELAPDKIRGLLGEFDTLYLTNEFLDLSIPIIESIDKGKIYYVGDTHGSIMDTHKCIQFFLKQIHKAEETGEELLIIFDGDYVDRNQYDIHNILYIFSFTLIYPKYVRILRGNHEDVTISMNYGFWENINTNLPNSYLFNDFGYIFMKLPLVHICRHQHRQIMCVHGGIPFYDREFEEMPIIPNISAGLDRLDSQHSNLDEMDFLSQQILWSDPGDELPVGMYFLPSPRGAGFTFGEDVFNRFCEVNQIDRVVRGHEVYLDGHREYFNDRLFSLFSSSNYSNQEIKAKIMEIDFTKPWGSNWRLLTIMTDLD